jgi:hypothetical protein
MRPQPHLICPAVRLSGYTTQVLSATANKNGEAYASPLNNTPTNMILADRPDAIVANRL